MNIAILGGSFDPPHKGHITIANRLLKLYHFDQIWLMPCYQHPFNKPLSAPDKRLEMTKFLEKGRIRVSDLEIRKGQISYTIDTLRFLAKNRPKDKFCWIIGTDQADSFTKWKEWKEIINNFKFIIVPRTGFRQAEKELKNIAKQVTAPKNITLIDRKRFPPIYISSTLARKRIRENEAPRSKLRGIKAEFLRSQPHFAKASLGVPLAPSSSKQALRFSAKGNKSIANMVPKGVEEYIIRNKLYQ